MLGKLLKYEFKSTSRLLTVIYLAILVLSLVLGLSGRPFFQELVGTNTVYPDESMMEAHVVPFLILLIIYCVLIMALVIITFVAIIQRFYHNLLKGEGYLMHTLPVPTWMLVASKTICAFIWEILGVAAVIVSLIIMLTSSGILQIFFRDILPYIYADLFELMNRNLAGTIVLVIIDIIIQAICMILAFYVSMSIGGSARKHKKLLSVVTFICIVAIMEIIVCVCNIGELNSAFRAVSGEVIEMNLVLVKDIVANAIYSVVFFALTTVFLQKKLNLE